jgi:putative tryptophan/tyrosine transport system substrate-binding protein
MLGRRAFIAAAGALLAAPRALAQQRGRVYRLAYAATANMTLEEMVEGGEARYSIFVQELRRLGWVEGQNLRLERWPLGARPTSDYAVLTRQIAATGPDAIFVSGRLPAQAFLAATSTIPIIFTSPDPVGNGLARSLARPGGNATGFGSEPGPEFYQKRVQLLKQAVASATRFAFLTRAITRADNAARYAPAAKPLGIEIEAIEVDDPPSESGMKAAFTQMVATRIQALVLTDTPQFNQPRMAELIAELALESRIPTMAANRSLAVAGVMMVYDTSGEETMRKSAGYIDRVLKGVNPRDLPVQLPTEFNFIVNLKTARALGIELPLNIMGFVSEYIE